jgi:hypothetical protein
MSRREMIFLMSRAFALVLIAWIVTDVTYLPSRILSLSHHMQQRGVLAGPDYWTTYYSTELGLLLLRMLLWSVGAGMFWQCGERVERLFLDNSRLAAVAPGSEPQP